MIGKIFDYKNKKGLAFQFRKKRAEEIKKIIKKIRLDKNEVTVIDMGGTDIFWQAIGYDFLKEQNVRITLVNLDDYKTENQDIFKCIKGDACALNFQNNEFDLSFSNSVIEHVGDYSKMIDFAKEMKRVAKIFYCQSPNYWFPIEPHFFFPFFQFLPDPVKILLIKNFSIGHFPKAKNEIDAINIMQDAKFLTKSMVLAFFEEGYIKKEKFMFLTKSLMISNAFERLN